MKHLDLTIDFETCALSANAAVMQVAIVPWRRDAKDDPFAVADEAERWPDHYEAYVDLRSCVVEGMDFDPATIDWWSRQSDEAKHAVCQGLAEPIADVTVGILDYLRDIVAQYQFDSICLWAHGDTDISQLRSLCRRFDIDLESIIPHTQLRDCRTVILEAAYKLACQQHLEDISTAATLLQNGTPVPCPAVSPQEVLAGSRMAYDLFSSLPSQYDGIQHDAIYDATRSTWYTWQALKTLRQ